MSPAGSRVPECEHRSISAEAYTAPAHDPARMARTTVYLCRWPRDRLTDAPRWVDKSIGGGLMIHPETDCRDCPALRKREGGSNG